MNRPAFLECPQLWTRSGSRSYDPVRDAVAVEHHRAGHRADYVIAALFVAFVLMILGGVL